MAASSTIPQPSPEATARSRRSPGRWLFAFFLALYLLTGSGHGYSSDGEYAFRMSRSLLVDSDHGYLKVMLPRLSHWGMAVPVLSQPLAVIGDLLANAMPQKDQVAVDGRTHVLGYYRPQGSPDDGPTVGPAASGARDSYLRQDLPVGRFTSLAVISFLGDARQIAQGTAVAEITLVGADGDSETLPLRAGVETSDWGLASGSDARHGMARVASVWSGGSKGRNYYATIPLGRALAPQELQVRYLLPEGRLYVRSLALLNGDAGVFQQLPSDQRVWSERENYDTFTRLFFSSYNAFTTAASCLLLFALAGVLGYGARVSVAVALIYGLATLAWPYSKYDFSEPTLTLFVLATLYLILRWGRERRDRLLLLAGIAALAAVGTKYAAGALVPFFLLQIVLLHWDKSPSDGLPRRHEDTKEAGDREKGMGTKSLPPIPHSLFPILFVSSCLRGYRMGAIRPVLIFSAPFIALAAPALWYLSSRYGYWPSILETWNGIRDGWFPLPFWIGFSGLLFSPGRGFFLYSPPTVLALISVVAFVRRHGVRTVALLATVLFYFGPAYSMKVAWHGGAGWGPRYQVLAIPLVILVAAPLIRKAIEERHRWARYALVATFLLGFGLQLMAVSKSFDLYLGMFRYEIVGQLPDQGARFGGDEYYPYSQGLEEGNTLTATLLAWPFTPILAQGWLLSADLLAHAPGFLQPAKEAVLANPPWKLFWGIDVLPAHPEYGLGTDFWSLRLRTDFPSDPAFIAGILVVLVLLEAVLVVAGARLVSLLFASSSRRIVATRVWVVSAVAVLLLFDALHASY